MHAEHLGTKQKVKVCCFCERWESGGIESFLFNVLSRIDLKELQIDLVAASLGKSIFTEPLQQRGIQFYELSGSQKNVLENHKRFASLLKERHWDVVHLNIFHGLSLSYLNIARQGGVLIRIAHSHNTALRKSVTRTVKLAIHTWARKRFVQYATDLWACSKGAAEFLFGPSNAWSFIPNGIDVQKFRFDQSVREMVRKKLGMDGKLVVGNVGRLCYQKNQSFLLDVFKEVRRLHAESVLILVGEGGERPFLSKKAQQLGIAEEVIFYDVTSHVEELLWAMDIFVLPSHFEGLPVTSVEAQAAGLPCLFADAVTRECRIGEKVWFLPLNAPPQRWAELAIQAAAAMDRAEGVAAVQAAGFDAADVSRRIENFYLTADA